MSGAGIAPTLAAKPNWEGRSSFVVLVLSLLVGQRMTMKHSGSAELLIAVFLGGLGISTVMAIVAAARHRRGWIFLILPACVWTFIGLMYGLWLAGMRH